MKVVYTDIKAQIQAQVPEILHIALFNNQIELLKNEENNTADSGSYTNSIYSFARPALFVEFVNPIEIKQLGGGLQEFDLQIKIHIVHDFYNGDNMEEDLTILDLKDNVYKALQGFEPTKSVSMVRKYEEVDYDHGNLNHYIQVYETNYVESVAERPLNGIVIQPPITLDLDKDLDIDNPVIRTGDGE